MKKWLVILLLVACKKDSQVLVGNLYYIKSNVFNKGAYQPVQPVKVDSIYMDQTYNIPYCICEDQQKTLWYIPIKDLK